MPKIILQTGETLDAVQGSIGLVPFKCWDVNGSEGLKARILKRNASSAAYYVLGSAVKGLIERAERGSKHSARNRRHMAKGERAGWKKYYSKINVSQRKQGTRSYSAAKQD